MTSLKDNPFYEEALLFDHVVVEIGWNDGDGDGLASLVNDLRDLLVLHANDVLSVHLELWKL